MKYFILYKYATHFMSIFLIKNILKDLNNIIYFIKIIYLIYNLKFSIKIL
jgi:hypothetical protein